MTASCVLISSMNSVYVVSEVYCRMRSTASSISLQRRRISDCSDISDLGSHPLPYYGFQGIGCHQVDGGTEIE